MNAILAAKISLAKVTSVDVVINSYQKRDSNYITTRYEDLKEKATMNLDVFKSTTYGISGVLVKTYNQAKVAYSNFAKQKVAARPGIAAHALDNIENDEDEEFY
jgi:hypothetical protein